MPTSSWIEMNRLYWNAHANLKSVDISRPLMQLLSSRVGTLRKVELDRIGPVHGRRVVHLQCHNGVDTVSWERLGAKTVGIDFSFDAIRIARRLALRVSSSANFVCSDVADLCAIRRDQFDTAVATYGVLEWIQDLGAWMQNAFDLLAPGGRLQLIDTHPECHVFRGKVLPYSGSPQKRDGKVTLAHGRSLGLGTPSPDFLVCRWSHSLDEIVNAAEESGFAIDSVVTFGKTFYPAFSDLELRSDGYWHPARGTASTRPLMFALTAEKRRFVGG